MSKTFGTPSDSGMSRRLELCGSTLFMEQEVHIGEIIRLEMDRAGVNQTELAEKLNKTRKTVWSMLQQADIHTKALRDVGDILGCDLFEIISESRRPTELAAEDAAEYSRKPQSKGAKLMLMVELDDTNEVPDLNEQLRQLMEKSLKGGPK